MNRLHRTDWVVLETRKGYVIEAAPNAYFWPGVAVIAACPTRLAARAALRLLTGPQGSPQAPTFDGTPPEENS